MLSNLEQNVHFETPVWERQLRIQSTYLRLGHYVSSLDIHWKDTPFSLQGVMVHSRKQLKWFQDNCHWVVIDLKKSRLKSGSKVPPQFSLSEYKKPITRHSMKTALKSYVGLEREISSVIKNMRSGQLISTDQMRGSINQIAEQLFEHGPALIWLTHIKSRDNYTAEHCMNVAILAMGLALSLGWKTSEVQEAGLAGLLHDVGKTMVPQHILTKPGALTQEEFEVMQGHTTHGFDLLMKDNDLPKSVKQATLYHHERPDGRGYPKGLHNSQIADIAALVSVVDAYDAITSNRCYQEARNHHLALGILWKGRGTQFNSEMVEAFIQWIGWVSPGTIVRLTTGDTAIVVLANPGNRLQPTVRLIQNQNDRVLLGSVQELSSTTDALGDPVYISEVLDATQANIDMRELARQMLVSSANDSR